MGTGSRFVAAFLTLAFSGLLQAAERPQIQFAEKIAGNIGTAQTQFDAYGRRFALNLQSNDRALGQLKLKHSSSVAGYRLWRGTLEGQSGSWIRLTERAGASEGVIWDGSDLYVVTRYEKIATSLQAPLTAQAGDTVVFRLSDSTNLLPRGYCGTGPSPDGLAANNSLVQYRNMVAALQVQAMAVATRQIEISMIADSAMLARVTDPIAEMLSSYNIVDGIYAEQLGLLIVPTDIRSIPAAGDPFTATDASTLLGQLETYRRNTPAIASLGIAHLFTGHDLEGTVIGIARLSGACTANDAVSLTEGWHGFVSSALVMAHEIGHNFGAEHDGAGACAAVPDNFIMSPYVNGSHEFSQCSRNAINSFLASASCVTPAVYAQVELPQTPVIVTGETNVPLVVPFNLHSTGTRAVNNVRLDLRIHESLVLTGTPAGVTCAPVSLGLSCDVGSIAAGVTQRVELTFLPGREGGFPTEARVSASNNQNTRNSSQGYSINVLSNVDVSVSVATSASAVTFGDMVDVTLTLRSLKSHTAHDVRVGVYDGGLRGVSVTAPAGVTCQFDVNFPGQTTCSVGDMPGGTTRTIVVHSRASQVGTALWGTAYASASNDSVNSNNNANFSMSVAAAHDVGLEYPNNFAPVQFNMPFEYRANLRSYGLLSVDGVRVGINLFMADSAALNSVSSVTVGGNTCTRLESWQYDCVVGTMAAGEVLSVSIRGIATGLGETRVTLNSYAAINNNTSNDRIQDGWIVRYGLDASITHSMFPVLIEGQEGFGSIAVWSNGTQAASNAVMNLELPPQVRFTRFDTYQSMTTSCSIINPQHLRCIYNIPPASPYQNIHYLVVGDVAGAYQATATVTLAGDENPSNNSAQLPITVNAAVDAGVRTSVVFPDYLIAGHNLTVPLEVFTGSRPINDVSLTVLAQLNAELASVSSAVGSCSRVNAQAFTCALGNLAGGSSVALTAVVRTASSSSIGTFSARVDAPSDNIQNNNIISATFNIAAVGDARVAVAATTHTATAGAAFSLPGIAVWRQGQIVQGRLRITLPSGVVLNSMSGSVFACSGTNVVECDLPFSWPEHQGVQADLVLQASAAGTYVITAQVFAFNDFNNANDTASISVTVNAAAPPSPPASPPPTGGGGSSSGGGGGRIEWPVALLLGWMLMRRAAWVRRQKSVKCSPRRQH